MKRKIAIAAGVAAAVVAVIVGFIAWPRGASPVTESEALEAFRARATPSPAGAASTTTTAAPAATAGAPSLPAFGVYAFAATGGEEVERVYLPQRIAHLSVQRARHRRRRHGVVLHRHAQPARTPHGGHHLLRHLRRHASDTEPHQGTAPMGAVSPTAEMTCDPACFTGRAGPRRAWSASSLSLPGRRR